MFYGKNWQSRRFEEEIAMSNLNFDEILRRLNINAFLQYHGISQNLSRGAITEKLTETKCIKRFKGYWAVTNLGAIMWANNLEDFDNLSKKSN